MAVRLRGTADGQVFTGERIDQCQPFQRAAFDRLVVDEVIAPQRMAVFGTLHPAGAAALKPFVFAAFGGLVNLPAAGSGGPALDRLETCLVYQFYIFR